MHLYSLSLTLPWPVETVHAVCTHIADVCTKHCVYGDCIGVYLPLLVPNPLRRFIPYRMYDNDEVPCQSAFTRLQSASHELVNVVSTYVLAAWRHDVYVPESVYCNSRKIYRGYLRHFCWGTVFGFCGIIHGHGLLAQGIEGPL